MSNDEYDEYERLADMAERGELRPTGDIRRGAEARAQARAMLLAAASDDPDMLALIRRTIDANETEDGPPSEHPEA